MIYNIELEILSLILLGALYTWHRRVRKQPGLKLLNCTYLLTAIASLLNIARLWLNDADALIAVYVFVLLLICALWVCYFVKLYKDEDDGGASVCRIAVLAFVTALTVCVIIALVYPYGLIPVTLSLFAVFFTVYVGLQYKRATTDHLTGLPNRYGMDDEIEVQLEQYRKNEKDLFCVIACDMDKFKIINDTWGHDEGDRALTLVGRTLADVAHRNNAEVFRTGGDEFIIITDKTDGDAGEAICCEIDEEFEKLHFRDDFKIRISHGVKIFDSNVTLKELFDDADAKLYGNKRKKKETVNS